MSFAIVASASDIIIVLDPGHGGAEGGATRSGYREEIINQKIADYLKAELGKYQGVQVYLTRSNVSEPQMDRETRVNIAKVKKADALVSLHINATAHTSQTSLTGAFALVPQHYVSASATTARKLGTSILNGLAAVAGTRNNGYGYDDELGILLFAQKNDYTKKEATKLGIARTVLNTQIPSLIVEHCFIDNPNDRSKFLSSNDKSKKLALGDAEGIAKFFGLKKKGSSVIVKPTQTGLVHMADGTWYLYDTDGKPMHGLVKYKKKYYYCDYDGKCAKGWVWIGNRHYYFGNTTSQGLRGIHQIGKNRYFFKYGYSRMKWVTWEGKKYFCSRKDGRIMTNYWLEWAGNWYYLNANGNPWMSCRKKIDGVTYRFDAQGHCTNK